MIKLIEKSRILVVSLFIGYFLTGCSGILGTKVVVTPIQEGQIKAKNMCNLSIKCNDKSLEEEIIKTINQTGAMNYRNKVNLLPNKDSTVVNINIEKYETVFNREKEVIKPKSFFPVEYKEKEYLEKDLKIVRNIFTGIVKCKDVTFNLKIKIDVNDKNDKLLFSRKYKNDITYTRCENDRARIPYAPKVYKQLLVGVPLTIARDIITGATLQSITLFDELDIKLTGKQNEKFKKSLKFLDDNNIAPARELLKELNKEIDEKSYVILFNLAILYEQINKYDIAIELLLKSNNISKVNGKKISKIEEAIVRIKNNKRIINSIPCFYNK